MFAAFSPEGGKIRTKTVRCYARMLCQHVCTALHVNYSAQRSSRTGRFSGLVPLRLTPAFPSLHLRLYKHDFYCLQTKNSHTAATTPVRCEQGTLLTVTAVWLGVLSPGWTQRGDSLAFVQLLSTWSWHLCLVGERHDGGGGIGSGGHVLGVGEAVQVLIGGINGAVDRTLSGATHAVLLRLVQVVGDSGVCKRSRCCLV